MAAKISHIEIYRQSLVLLEHGNKKDQELSSLLEDQNLFRYGCFGAVAPDIFYFYHPMKSKKHKYGLYWADQVHHRRVFELVISFLDRVRRDSNTGRRNKRLAFALGYLSHCAADIVTHPYIFYITGNYYSSNQAEASKAQVNHMRVENILDSYLVAERWGISPKHYNFFKYVNIADSNGSLDFDIWQMWVNGLSVVYPDEFREKYVGSLQTVLKGDLIQDSFHNFVKFNRYVDTRSIIVRGLLRTIDAITWHRLKARFLILPPRHLIDDRYPNTQNQFWRYPADPGRTSNESYNQLVHRSAELSVELIRLAKEYVDGKKSTKDFKSFIGYNLDTGTITDSTGMFTFAPIPEI